MTLKRLPHWIAFAAALTLLTASKSRSDPSPPITARPAVLGGVFLDDEPVRWDISTNGDAVHWQVTDFGGAPVASGTAANGSLTIPLHRHGYFTLHLTAERGEQKTGEQDTTFAILAPAPKLGTASPFGVMTHFAQGWNQDIIPLIARLGAGEDRDEQYWNAVEKTPGQFVYPPSFESYMARLGQNGIASLTPLTFENNHYDGGQTPYTDAGFNGYAHYGQEIVKHYGPQIGAVEIWNEYNGSFCKGPATQDRAGTYVKMLKAAYPVLKRTRPDVLVLGCDTAGIPLPFLEKIFAAGGLQYMDGVSVHPYRYGSTPEGFENEIAGLDALIRKYNGGKPKPIWVTEMGWFLKKSQAPGDLTITESDQAKFAVRGDCLLLSAGVQKMFWYLFRDYNEFATMGLVRDERDPLGRYAPKPAYVAYAVMARQLAGARFVRREPAADGVYSLLFGRGGEDIRVLVGDHAGCVDRRSQIGAVADGHDGRNPAVDAGRGNAAAGADGCAGLPAWEGDAAASASRRQSGRAGRLSPRLFGHAGQERLAVRLLGRRGRLSLPALAKVSGDGLQTGMDRAGPVSGSHRRRAASRRGGRAPRLVRPPLGQPYCGPGSYSGRSQPTARRATASTSMCWRTASPCTSKSTAAARQWRAS